MDEAPAAEQKSQDKTKSFCQCSLDQLEPQLGVGVGGSDRGGDVWGHSTPNAPDTFSPLSVSQVSQSVTLIMTPFNPGELSLSR